MFEAALSVEDAEELVAEAVSDPDPDAPVVADPDPEEAAPPVRH